MKRKLNKTERELTVKGIASRKTEILVKSESLEMQEAAKTHVTQSRIYEDKLRPYNRKVEDKNFSVKIKLLESDLKIAKTDLENLEEQLKDGIEIKKEEPPTGIN